jgi:hypothetical protein
MGRAVLGISFLTCMGDFPGAFKVQKGGAVAQRYREHGELDVPLGASLTPSLCACIPSFAAELTCQSSMGIGASRGTNLQVPAQNNRQACAAMCCHVLPRAQSSDNRKPMKTILPLQLLLAPALDDPQPLILYHGKGCSDGFAAALAAWIYYEGRAEFMGLDHGQVQTLADLPAVEGRAVYIIYLSLPADNISAH